MKYIIMVMQVLSHCLVITEVVFYQVYYFYSYCVSKSVFNLPVCVCLIAL